MLTNRITLSKLNNYIPKVDFYDDNNDIFSLTLNNHRFKLDFYKNHTYSNSPIEITGGKDNDGSIKANNNYSLELACRKLSFFDGTPYQKQTANNDATDLNSAISLVNNLKKILKNYGLIKKK